MMCDENSNELTNNSIKSHVTIHSDKEISNEKYNIMISDKKLVKIFGDNDNFISKLNQCDEKEKFELVCEGIREIFPNLPVTLIPATVGAIFDNSNDEKFIDDVPLWYDREKFVRGQRFACDNMLGVISAELLGIFSIYSFEDDIKSIIFTGKSSGPYNAFKRYLSTINTIINWYTSDPWSKGTAAYNDIKRVNKSHIHIRNKLNNLPINELDKSITINNPWSPSREILIDDFRSLCPAGQPGQCPYAMDTIRDMGSSVINQGELASSQFIFYGLIILFPKAFGIHSATEDDLEAFCHVWRVIGYLLGIKDEYNFCSGSFNEIKQRSNDILEFWIKPNFRNIAPEWEHITRSIVAGANYYIPGIPYESLLLYYTDILGFEMPRFRSTLSYNIKMRYNIIRLFTKYLYKFSIIRIMANRLFLQRINYATNLNKDDHAKLREQSLNTMSIVLGNKSKSDDKYNDKKSLMVYVLKYWQYKVIGILIVIIIKWYN